MPDEREKNHDGRSKWVSTAQAQAVLELPSPLPIYKLRYAGKLKAYTLPGVNALRWLRTDIEALMQEAPYVPKSNDERRPAAAGV